MQLGSTLFVKVKKIFRQKMQYYFLNYNLTPLTIPSLSYQVEEAIRIQRPAYLSKRLPLSCYRVSTSIRYYIWMCERYFELYLLVLLVDYLLVLLVNYLLVLLVNYLLVLLVNYLLVLLVDYYK